MHTCCHPVLIPLIVWILCGRPSLIVVVIFITTQYKLLITSNEVFNPESELSFAGGVEQTNPDDVSSTVCRSVLSLKSVSVRTKALFCNAVVLDVIK